MKNFFKIFSFLILLFALTIESFAIDSPVNLNIDSTTNNSVNLSWDSNEEAFMYYVYYSKKSGADTWYDMQTDFIEYNSLEISDLEIGETYYFVVVALDENWDESDYSNEVIVDIVDPNAIISNEDKTSNDDAVKDITEIDFALNSINVVEYNKIELIFSNTLDDSEDTIREFKIVNTDDNLDTFEVVSTKLNNEDFKVLELTLDRNTEIWNEYEVVIIAITSETWKNIESWIDNTEIFSVVEISETDLEIEENNVELNAASEEAIWPTWANINASEIENTTLSLSKNNENLPKTWPEHILMFILSIVLWALIFVFKYKKV